MTFLRSATFNLLFYALLIGMMVTGLPVMLAGARAVKAYAQCWARLSLRLFCIVCRVRIEVRGGHNLPRAGVIIASKHQSFLDILLLLSIAPRFIFVLKRELMFIPVFGQFLNRCGMIPVDRARGRAALGSLTERVRTALREGLQLVIFPEGTRRSPGAEPRYKSGVSHLYAAGGVPCVPVALNSGLFWPRRSFLRRPGLCIVEVLPPISPGEDRVVFLAELQERIETTSDRLLHEARAFLNRAPTRQT